MSLCSNHYYINICRNCKKPQISLVTVSYLFLFYIINYECVVSLHTFVSICQKTNLKPHEWTNLCVSLIPTNQNLTFYSKVKEQWFIKWDIKTLKTICRKRTLKDFQSGFFFFSSTTSNTKSGNKNTSKPCSTDPTCIISLRGQRFQGVFFSITAHSTV